MDAKMWMVFLIILFAVHPIWLQDFISLAISLNGYIVVSFLCIHDKRWQVVFEKIAVTISPGYQVKIDLDNDIHADNLLHIGNSIWTMTRLTIPFLWADNFMIILNTDHRWADNFMIILNTDLQL